MTTGRVTATGASTFASAKPAPSASLDESAATTEAASAATTITVASAETKGVSKVALTMLSSEVTTASTASAELNSEDTASASSRSAPRPVHKNVNVSARGSVEGDGAADAGSVSIRRPTLPTSRCKLRFLPAVKRSSRAINLAMSLPCCCSVSSEALTIATPPLTGRSVITACTPAAEEPQAPSTPASTASGEKVLVLMASNVRCDDTVGAGGGGAGGGVGGRGLGDGEGGLGDGRGDGGGGNGRSSSTIGALRLSTNTAPSDPPKFALSWASKVLPSIAAASSTAATVCACVQFEHLAEKTMETLLRLLVVKLVTRTASSASPVCMATALAKAPESNWSGEIKPSSATVAVTA